MCAVPCMTLVTALHPVLTAIHNELCSISLDPRLAFFPAKLIPSWHYDRPTGHRHCPSFQLPMPTRPSEQARHQPVSHTFSWQGSDSLDFMRADEAGIRGEGVYGGGVPLSLLAISYDIVTKAVCHKQSRLGIGLTYMVRRQPGIASDAQLHPDLLVPMSRHSAGKEGRGGRGCRCR